MESELLDRYFHFSAYQNFYPSFEAPALLLSTDCRYTGIEQYRTVILIDFSLCNALHKVFLIIGNIR